MLVIHENRGLTDHIRSSPARFAGDGYTALAIDLLSEEGGTAALGDAGMRPPRWPPPHRRLVGDMPAGLDELDAAPRRQARCHRLLLRRRHGLDAARCRRAAPGRGHPVLWPGPVGTRLQRQQGGGPRRLRRARRPGKREPRTATTRARSRRTDPRDRRPTRAPTTRSSTTPAGATTRPRRPPPTPMSWPGSAGTSPCRATLRRSRAAARSRRRRRGRGRAPSSATVRPQSSDRPQDGRIQVVE